ncbi:DUF7344 domain-containing protein [Halorussus litoreus]|uniref:DUF7344 domain-containing protein n=1 Tax=Halorussus litoreus TaxID=1710536 RepID=UPI000E21ECDB|nr:hypothetical protein [Halorussus litoreus]
MVRCQDEVAVHERIDRSLDLLESAHRRRVVYVLRENGTATIDDLADAVVDAGLADGHDRVRTSLVHVHLPKLRDFDVVEYAGPDGTVSLADGVARLDPFLDAAAREETTGESVPATECCSDAVAGSRPE